MATELLVNYGVQTCNMRKTLMSILICITLNTLANPAPQTYTSLYKHLISVNPEWERHIFEKDQYAGLINFENEDALLQQHFISVISYLKKNKPSHLTRKQIQKRKKLLRVLERYWKAKKFPRNFDHVFEKKPCFIDEIGGVCAVGQLLMSDDQEKLAYTIAAEMKYLRIKEMHSDDLLAWQQQSGFTVEELALIQPSYGYRPRSAVFLTPNFGIDLVGLNTVKTANGNPLFNFSSIYSWQTGFNFSSASEKNFSFTTGLNYKRYVINETIEADFAPGNYGMIKSTANLNYIIIPLLFGKSNLNTRHHSIFKFGLISSFYRSYKQTSTTLGSATKEIALTYAIAKKEIAHYIPVLYMCYSTDVKILKTRKSSICLHLEPNLSYGVTKMINQSYTNGYRPLTIGLNTGLSLVHIEGSRGGF